MKKKTKKCKICEKVKKITEFKINRRCKDGYTNICKTCINNLRKDKSNNLKLNNKQKYYIYKFLDNNDNVIYVGQTIDMEKRMYQHKSYNYKNYDLYSNIYKVRYAEVESDYHMNIYEIHYICKYNPKYNIQFKSENKNLFQLPEVIWETYIPKEFIKNARFNCTIRTGQQFNNIEDFVNSTYYKKCLPEFEYSRKVIDNYFDDYDKNINITYVNDINEYFNPYIDDDFYYAYESHFSDEDLGLLKEGNTYES